MGIPFLVPGFHFGIKLTTLNASSSQPPPIPRKIIKRVTSPFFSIANVIYKVP